MQNYNEAVSARYEDLLPQRGRDIIVETTTTIDLFGITFSPIPGEEIKIYIECKETNKITSLSTERHAANTTQNINSECDAFILVTNANFSVNALFDYWKLMSEKRHGAWIVEGNRLRDIYHEIGEDCPFSVTDRKTNEIDGVYWSSCLERITSDYPQEAELTFALINNTHEHRSGKIIFQSCENWKLRSEPETLEYYFDLPPHGFHAHRFSLVREIPDRAEQLSLALSVRRELVTVRRKVKEVGRIAFRSNFVGCSNKAALDNLLGVLLDIDTKAPLEHGQLHILSVTGAAGTGKSRLVAELRRRNKHAFHWVTHYFGSRRKSSVQDTLLDIRRGGFALHASGGEFLEDNLIEAFATMKGKRARVPVLVLDDAHLAGEDACRVLLNLSRVSLCRSGHCRSSRSFSVVRIWSKWVSRYSRSTGNRE